MDDDAKVSSFALWAAATVVIIALVALLTYRGTQSGNPSQPPAQPPAAFPHIPVTRTVTVSDFAFDPKELAAHAGDTVVWSYPEGRFNHVIVVRDLDVRSPRLYPGDEWQFTFNATGEYTIVDAVYDSMLGLVNVTG